MATAIRPDEVTAVLREELGNFTSETDTYEVGTVLQVGDGIARLYGLSKVQAGELIEFPESGVTGMVLNLEEDNVGAVLFGEVDTVKEGHEARRTGRIASIKVGEGMLGPRRRPRSGTRSTARGPGPGRAVRDAHRAQGAGRDLPRAGHGAAPDRDQGHRRDGPPSAAASASSSSATARRARRRSWSTPS